MSSVQKRVERMAGELDQMRRIKLFSQEHCRNILKMRKHYEHKIHATSKNKEDFLDYIEYEKGLLKTIRFRRNSLKIGEKMGDIEHKIMNRIKELYETISQRYRDDTSLCLSYFMFCKVANYKNAAAVAISNMLKNHSHNAEIWQVAARWYAYDRKEISAALSLICKGLTMHKDSRLLYTEAIQLEIYNALDGNLQLKVSPEELNDSQKLCLEKLQTYIKEINNNIADCEYCIELLNYLVDYSFTTPVQYSLIEYLMNNYSNRALTWNVLAQRDWKGQRNPMDTDPPVKSIETKLGKCISRYKEGLGKVVPEEKELLWSYFINCLIDVRQEDNRIAVNLKTDSLKEALAMAFNDGFLTEKYYIQWLDLVEDNEKIEILKRGIEKLPQSVELWKVYLRTQILSDNKQGIEAVFKAGIKALEGKALPLWTGVIRYHLLASDDDTLEKLYKEGVKQPAEVSDSLKPEFIEWLAVAKGMRVTREQYLVLANEKPYCKELHATMSKLEATEIEFNFPSWDKVHELACEQFGEEDVDVWINRIQYYMDFKRGIVSKALLQQVYTDAQNSLPEMLFLTFKDKYYAMTSQWF